MASPKKFGFAQAARRLGLTVERYASIKGASPERRFVFRISHGSQEVFTLGATLLSTSFIGMKISEDKATTNEILRHQGIPTTEQLLVADPESLEKFYTKYHGDILMKPLASTLGQGIYGNLQSLTEAQAALASIQKGFGYALAEKKIRGKEYRVLVFENHVIAVAEFIPPTLVGDGKNTILHLIEGHNALIANTEGSTPIPIKPELMHILAEQGLTLSMIPALGLVIPLYRAAPISHGGKAIDATTLVHPKNKQLFLRAAKAISLNIAGIDVITEDIGKPLEETGGVILEINGGPDLSLHHRPVNNPRFDAAEAILRIYFHLP